MANHENIKGFSFQSVNTSISTAPDNYFILFHKEKNQVFRGVLTKKKISDINRGTNFLTSKEVIGSKQDTTGKKIENLLNLIFSNLTVPQIYEAYKNKYLIVFTKKGDKNQGGFFYGEIEKVIESYPNVISGITYNNGQTTWIPKYGLLGSKNKRNTNDWLIVDTSNGLVVVRGSDSQIKTRTQNFFDNLSATDLGRAKYILIKLNRNGSGTRFHKGTLTDPVTFDIIKNYLGSDEVDLPQTDSEVWDDGSSGGSYGDGGGSSLVIQTPTSKPISINDGISQLSYINDFSSFKLVFHSGKDARTDITDHFENPADKLAIDENRLILRNNVPQQQFEQVDSEMSLSDKYYSYSKIAELDYEVSNFFTLLDNILNLNFERDLLNCKEGTNGTLLWDLPQSTEEQEFNTNNTVTESWTTYSLSYAPNKCWNNSIPPLVCLNHKEDITSYYEENWENFLIKWKLLPMTALAVDKKWYQSLTKYINEEKGITIEQAQQNLTLEDCLFDTDAHACSLYDFFVEKDKKRTERRLCFFDVTEEKINEAQSKIVAKISPLRDFSEFLNNITSILKFAEKLTLSCDLVFEQKRKALNLYELKLFEAYTRGHDFIQEDYTTVRPQEQDVNGNKYMSFDENYFVYKYTGRDFDITKGRTNNPFTISDGVSCVLVHEKDLLTESDVTLGDTYNSNHYFVETMKYYDDNNSQLSNDYIQKDKYIYHDTFKIKNYLDVADATKHVEEDIEILTTKIDLTQCEYYDANAATYENGWCDCCYTENGKGEFVKECIYQKLGHCPYRFTAEKHPRRIRTLSAEKSNRFNLIQETSEVFEIYPQFYIEFDNNGRILLDEQGRMKKHIFYITEKGNHRKLGFRYEKNLNDISRTVDSTSITTKLFVEDIDSELSNTGLCSIETAEDNIGRNRYIMDFSYYTQKGMLNAEQVVRDIYGLEKGDLAFLPTIGYYNRKYDDLTNLIINMTGESMTALKAANIISVESISTGLEERQKVSQRMYQFKIKRTTNGREVDYTTSDTYKSYLLKLKEQATILWGAIEDLFFNDNYFCLINSTTDEQGNKTFSFETVQYNYSYNIEEPKNLIETQKKLISLYSNTYCRGELFWRLMIEGFEEQNFEEPYIPPFESWADFKEDIIEPHLYPINGKEGQYKAFYDQVKKWKTQRAEWLNKINDISDIFYKKYEPYIKEGTWSDSNYLTSNEYYWAAEQVLADSAKPKVTYSITVSDLSPLDDDYEIDIADTSFIEDIDFFGINPKTGLPNQQKVMVSSITEDLDNPTNNSIEVQNFTTAFEDLFESISASVQSLSFNENTYKRAANFTATKYVSKESLQGTLFEGDLTLMDINNQNVVIDDEGAHGKDINNTSNQYKLTGEGLLFSKDGGTTWDIGVGPNGINADYIKLGQLDASKIQIVDGNYIYFLWDQNGITAYRNPSTSTNGLVDFTRFNKYGLSLIENNNVRLRAGYEFRTNQYGDNSTGEYTEEQPLTNQNVGFYLYNDTGQPIFKTETSSMYNNVSGDYSARLSLAGEMFVTNRVLEGDNDGSIINAKPEYVYSGGYDIADLNAIALGYPNAFTEAYNEYSTQGSNYSYSILKFNKLQSTDGQLQYVVDNKESFQLGNATFSFYRVIETIAGVNLEYYTNYEKNSITKTSDTDKVRPMKLKYEVYRIPLKYAADATDNEYDTNGILTGKILECITNPTAENNLMTLYQERMNEIAGLEGENKKVFTSTAVTYSDLYEHTVNGTATITSGVNEKFYALHAESPNASSYTVENVEKTSLIVWNIANMQPGDIVSDKSIIEVYQITPDKETKMRYFGVKELTGKLIEENGEDSGGISTQEVGIFLNNKTSIHGGSEQSRLYNSYLPLSSGTENEESEEIVEEDSPTESEVLSRSIDTRALSRSSGSTVDMDSDDFFIAGDSITVGLSSIMKNAWGLGSSSVDESRLYPTYIVNKNDKISNKKDIAVFWGTNDVNGVNDGTYSEETYMSLYAKLIYKMLQNNGLMKDDSTAKDDITIYILSLPYLKEKYASSNSQKEFNSILEQLSKKLTTGFNFSTDKKLKVNSQYIDIWDDTKGLPRTDNVHFTTTGYKQLKAVIQDKLEKTTTNVDAFNQEQQKVIEVGLDESRQTILGGAERIFTIALTGQDTDYNTVYNNILTVLKNGCLYLGGTVTDFYGRPLNLSSFNYLPDEIRIRDCAFVMGNDGRIWMNFERIYAIKDGSLSDTSLWSLLEQAAASGGGGGTSSDEAEGETVTGYYFIDPIAD